MRPSSSPAFAWRSTAAAACSRACPANVMKTYTIAVMPGDGIGKEVVPEGLRVLESVGAKFGIGFRFRHFDWSCESYKTTGSMMPADGGSSWRQQRRTHVRQRRTRF